MLFALFFLTLAQAQPLSHQAQGVQPLSAGVMVLAPDGMGNENNDGGKQGANMCMYSGPSENELTLQGSVPTFEVGQAYGSLQAQNFKSNDKSFTASEQVFGFIALSTLLLGYVAPLDFQKIAKYVNTSLQTLNNFQQITLGTQTNLFDDLLNDTRTIGQILKNYAQIQEIWTSLSYEDQSTIDTLSRIFFKTFPKNITITTINTRIEPVTVRVTRQNQIFINNINITSEVQQLLAEVKNFFTSKSSYVNVKWKDLVSVTKNNIQQHVTVNTRTIPILSLAPSFRIKTLNGELNFNFKPELKDQFFVFRKVGQWSGIVAFAMIVFHNLWRLSVYPSQNPQQPNTLLKHISTYPLPPAQGDTFYTQLMLHAQTNGNCAPTPQG